MSIFTDFSIGNMKSGAFVRRAASGISEIRREAKTAKVRVRITTSKYDPASVYVTLGSDPKVKSSEIKRWDRYFERLGSIDPTRVVGNTILLGYRGRSREI